MATYRSFLLILLLAIAAPSLRGQAQRDSSGAPEGGRKRHTPEFIDENGDGINDRHPGQRGSSRRGNDTFIDRDGDGICDGRASGLGFRRGVGVGGGTAGTEGKGKGKRQGGKP